MDSEELLRMCDNIKASIVEDSFERNRAFVKYIDDPVAAGQLIKIMVDVELGRKPEQNYLKKRT